jgi:serine/threonine-protein kinase
MTHQAHDDLLATILEDLRAECARGQVPDIDVKAAAHPELATELRQLWATIEFLEELTPKQENPVSYKNPINLEPSENFPRSFGNYELLKVLGRGGMGVVYKARQRSLNRIVALKMIRKGENASPEELARFQAEALVASRIVHANVVPVLDAGTIDNQPFFVMLYLEGETLAQRLVREPLRQDEAGRIVALLARAIHSAHLTGLLHRDLKPSNIIFNRAGVPHVSDFGLAKVFNNGLGTDWHSNQPATVSGTILGTPGYMAPEVMTRQNHGISVDYFALGVITYELMFGKRPY